MTTTRYAPAHAHWKRDMKTRHWFEAVVAVVGLIYAAATWWSIATDHKYEAVQVRNIAPGVTRFSLVCQCNNRSHQNQGRHDEFRTCVDNRLENAVRHYEHTHRLKAVQRVKEGRHNDYPYVSVCGCGDKVGLLVTFRDQ